MNNQNFMLHALSPLDGRYRNQIAQLSNYFSEHALIRYRVTVEVVYLKALINLPLSPLGNCQPEIVEVLDRIVHNFDESDSQEIKNIEKTTNHDVKAVEYFIKNRLEQSGFGLYKEFVHFGLTSQDINNTAFPMMIKSAMTDVMVPALEVILSALENKIDEYSGISMLARTHGQPASPTTMGKEWAVFKERITDELTQLKNLPIKCKFGGATGNFNAHKVSYPKVDWPSFANQLAHQLGLKRSQFTTQISHYDDLAAIFHTWSRINTILIDFCRDMWTYISMEYFTQKTREGEVGSSAMPHKVNPIDFENAEGNLGMANAIFSHLAEKLPISRLQRDLTDSTVLRNVGVPFGHTLIAYKSIIKGIEKLMINTAALEKDLDNNWVVIAEAIQNILRRELYPEPYEALKALTRGKTGITKMDIQQFVMNLNIGDDVKKELLAITPHNYIGYK
jgi:adenylosuccinate lyase